MNELSWIIYIASIVGSLNTLFSWIAYLGLFFTFVSALIALISLDMEEAVAEKCSKQLYWLVPVTLIAGLITSIIPDKNTVYAIAASEVGEKVVNDPRVQQTTNKAFKALDVWLDQQIDKPKLEEKKAETDG